MDAELRQLERQAAAGSAEARESLERARRRAGQGESPWLATLRAVLALPTVESLGGPVARVNGPLLRLLAQDLVEERLADVGPGDLLHLQRCGRWDDPRWSTWQAGDSALMAISYLCEQELIARHCQRFGAPWHRRDPRQNPEPGDRVGERGVVDLVRAGPIGRRHTAVRYAAVRHDPASVSAIARVCLDAGDPRAPRDEADWVGEGEVRIDSWRRWARGRRVARVHVEPSPI